MITKLEVIIGMNGWMVFLLTLGLILLSRVSEKWEKKISYMFQCQTVVM